MASSKSIQIILARQLASSVAAPILLVDAEGTLVYYNESAEEIFNQRFDETGEMPAEEWTARIAAMDDERKPIAPEDRATDAGDPQAAPGFADDMAAELRRRMAARPRHRLSADRRARHAATAR